MSNKLTKRKVGRYASEGGLTVIFLGFIVSGLVGGVNLLGIIKLSHRVALYIGAALVAYVIVGTIVIVHLAVKFILRKDQNGRPTING